MRLRAGLLAAGLTVAIACTPHAAAACGSLLSREPTPDELQGIAAAAVEQAAFVDVAVAMLPNAAEPRVLPFQVVRRFKGDGAPRFTLFGSTSTAAYVPEAVRSRGSGLVYGWGAVEEPVEPDELELVSYCHRWSLRVTPGRTYLVLRDADGRLIRSGANIITLGQWSEPWLRSVAEAARVSR